MEPLTEADLQAIEARCAAASAGPWQSWVEGRDHLSGDSFIQVGHDAERGADMYVSRETTPASVGDQDFIAFARQDVPRLVAEVRRLWSREGAP